MNPPDKKKLMQIIIASVGKNEAVRLVSTAYDAEILTNRIGRLEATFNKTLAPARPATDLLLEALERVVAVCELSDT